MTLVNVQIDNKRLLELELWLAERELRLYHIPPYDPHDTSTWYLVDAITDAERERPRRSEPPDQPLH